MSSTKTASPVKPMTPDEIELNWFKNVYQGDSMPQLTLRAVLMGSALGAVMCLSNLYIGLKTGWALGVAITSCILSFSIFKTMRAVFPRYFRSDMSILENNCMQSTASSAGYSTGGTMVSGVAAYLILTGHHMPWHILILWTFFLAALGVFLAIPMKRQMINVEQLKFPSGIAAAETLKSLHAVAEGGGASIKARALGVAGLLGGLVTWFRDGRPSIIPGSLHFPGSINGIALHKWTVSFEMSTVMIAAGAIMGWRMAWSLLVGAAINYLVLAPYAVRAGAIETSKIGYRGIVGWSTWIGSALMVTSALLMFAFQWRSILRAFGGVARLFGSKIHSERDVLARIEVPTSWFLAGTFLSGFGCLAVLYYFFGTSWWMGIVAVVLTFFLSVVACRVTGESDITPIGAMGKITQLMFGVIAPTNTITNLMTASVTAGAAGSSADLLNDLKSGYCLGANPRKQFLAQFFGIFTGTLVIVPVFYILVPDAASLGTDRWPAPAAQVWAAVARLLANGYQALHPTARAGLLVGGLVGIIMPVIERVLPEKYRRFMPSPIGVGLAIVIPFYNSFSMFLGGLIALVLAGKLPKISDTYLIAVASGLIAGESLVGVLVAILAASGVL